jgi:DNA-directed RNA polymerase specialized sigma24 family protein
MERLSSADNRAGLVAELRVFGGLTMREVANVAGISERTAHDDWAYARAWLIRDLKE